MGLSYLRDFIRIVSTILNTEIASPITAIELANDCNDPQDVAPHTNGHHNGNDNENEAEGVIHGPTVLARVDLAKRVGMYVTRYFQFATN